MTREGKTEEAPTWLCAYFGGSHGPGERCPLYRLPASAMASYLAASSGADIDWKAVAEKYGHHTIACSNRIAFETGRAEHVPCDCGWQGILERLARADR